MSRLHRENHLVERIGWLRAAALGANDGIISTASLILGLASAAVSQSDVLLTDVAGLVAGAMSVAAGEYVSVSSQSDTEHADLAREKRELVDDPAFEREELAVSPNDGFTDNQAISGKCIGHESIEPFAHLCEVLAGPAHGCSERFGSRRHRLGRSIVLKDRIEPTRLSSRDGRVAS